MRFSEKVCTFARHAKPYSLRPTQFAPPSDGTDTEHIDLNAAAVPGNASIDTHILSVTHCKREMKHDADIFLVMVSLVIAVPATEN